MPPLAATDAQRLAALAGQGAALDPFEAALALAAPRHPGRSLDPLRREMQKLAAAAAARHETLRAGGAADDAGTRLAALKYALCEEGSFKAALCGPAPKPDAGDVICALDSRLAAPPLLALLHIAAAARCGWDAAALAFPGGGLVRVEAAGERLIVDAADPQRLLGAGELRAALKDRLGEAAELSASYYAPLSPLDTALAAHNYVKARLVEMEDYDAALDAVAAMRVLAPEDHRLLFDEGVLAARLGQLDRARESLAAYIGHPQTARADRIMAEDFLAALV